MRKSEAVNTFNNGLIMDINPLVTPNDVLVNALNATVITFNGNENVLQNDMGNGRVETAYLPEGYVPVGTAELGGIIYIVSYNPLIDKCLIGSFPSPERNITSDEIQTPSVIVSNDNFLADDSITRGKLVKNVLLKIKLLSDPSSEDGLFKLNPGDKYTIYATNVANNSKCLSDCLNNDPNKVDYTPRNITIHVVSLGEDGKITYLDDSLKWTVYEANDTSIEYYIKEVDAIEQSSILTDIDNYRSLVSSAYNIFNSKISGELALLFEVKVIESLLLTWDATVSDINDAEKQANIVFYANWTSSHKDINPKYLILSNSELVNVTSSNVGIGYWAEISGYSDRINDGTDSSVSVEVGNFTYDPDSTLEDCIWNYTVIPAMKFGELLYLAVSGTINFSEIGSGKMNIDEWRYYIQENNFYIDLGLDAYPEINKSINKLILTFIPFEEILIDNTILTDPSSEKDFEKYDKYPQYTISGKSSYSGYFQEIINFGLNVRVTNLGILKNYLYLVDIGIMYGSENNWEIRHNYKWLYTTDQWNLVYLDGEVTDFTTLTLDNYIGFKSIITVKDNIDPTTTNLSPIAEESMPITLSETLPSTSSEMNWVTLGYKVVTVCWSSVNDKFDLLKENIKVNIQVVPRDYTELFKFNLLSKDSFSNIVSEKTITHDEFVVLSDSTSSIDDYVISKIMDENTNLDDVKTALSNIENGTIDETNDEAAMDCFNATIVSGSDKGEVNINVAGVIFSRINADLKLSEVTVTQRVRPLLLYEEEGIDMGISSLTTLEYYYGFGQMYNKGGEGTGFIATRYDAMNNLLNWEETRDGGKDGYTFENYWECKAYKNDLNSWMLKSNCPFVPVVYSPLKDYLVKVNSNGWLRIDHKGSIWVRTNNNHYVPLHTFYEGTNNGKDSVPNIMKDIINCLVLIYYVDTNPDPIRICIVSNINKLKTYKETWNIELSSTLTVNSMADSLYLLDLEGNEISLQNLQCKCNPLSISTENITYNNPVLDLGSNVISHTFKINMEDLYTLYETLKSTTIPSIWDLITSTESIRGSSKNSNYIYAYDIDTSLMSNLNIISNSKLIQLNDVTLTSKDNRLILEGYEKPDPDKKDSTHLFQYLYMNDDNNLVVNEDKILAHKYTYRYYPDDSEYTTIYGNSQISFTDSPNQTNL